MEISLSRDFFIKQGGKNMLKLIETKNNFVEGNKKLCEIYADNKNEVVPNADVEGLGKIELLAAGSSCYTASLEVGILKSDGTWTW